MHARGSAIRTVACATTLIAANAFAGCAPATTSASRTAGSANVPAYLDARTHPLVWMREAAELCPARPTDAAQHCTATPTQKVRILASWKAGTRDAFARIALSSHRAGWVRDTDLIPIVAGSPVVDCDLNPNENVDYVDFVDESDKLEPALELHPPVRARLTRQESATIFDFTILGGEHNGAAARGFSLDGCSIELPDGTAIPARLSF